ncbi:SAM-dependent methyltransferase [Nocardia rhamnosiphila]
MPESRHLIPDQSTHPARLYHYFLSGSAHDEADRLAGKEVEKVTPTVRTMARTNRAFMHRVIHHLAEHAGIRQFLDIGSGIPAAPNLHQIAQNVAPAAQIVYVDNDPVVLARARDLPASTSEGSAVIMQGDITQPMTILSTPALRETLDLDQPVALSLISVLHFISDHHHPYEAVSTLLEALAPGSYLVLSHSTPDFDPHTTSAAVKIYRASGMDPQPRNRTEFARFFHGLDLIAPGIIAPHRWRNPCEKTNIKDAEVGFYAAVGRKPVG